MPLRMPNKRTLQKGIAATPAARDTVVSEATKSAASDTVLVDLANKCQKVTAPSTASDKAWNATLKYAMVVSDTPGGFFLSFVSRVERAYTCLKRTSIRNWQSPVAMCWAGRLMHPLLVVHHEQRDHNILVDTALPKSVPLTSSLERPPKSQKKCQCHLFEAAPLKLLVQTCMPFL